MAAVNALDFNPSSVELGKNYLLLGGDAFLVDMVSDQIRKRLKETCAADLFIFYGDEAKSALLNDLLDTYSIFSTAKMILLRNAETLKKAELDTLADYFQAPSEAQSLIIVAEKIDARLSCWKKIKESCQNVLCESPRWGAQMSDWLTKTLASMGKTMSKQTADLFLARVELDYADAYNELKKLALLTYDKPRITESDVMRSIGSSRVGTINEFHKALGNLQIRQSMELMDKMLASDWASLQVFSLLIRFCNTVHHILLLKNHHISPSEIIRSHLGDVYESQRQPFLNYAANYSLKKMESIFAILLDTDAKIKTSAASDSVLLANCVLNMLGTT